MEIPTQLIEPSMTASGKERFDYLTHVSTTLPAQHTDGWYAARFRSANSSAFGTMENVYGSRYEELQNAVAGKCLRSNFRMSLGTALEDTSGYLFTQTTGFEYQMIGSKQHAENPRIRGSLDGYGLDHKGRLFVLETKTHSSPNTDPGPFIGNPCYGKQVVQNIEIANADYGLFNAAKLLPCTTSDVVDLVSAHSFDSGCAVPCRFLRFNLARPGAAEEWKRSPDGGPPKIDIPSASDPPIHLVALEVKPSSPTSDLAKRVEWMGNPFDSLNGTHPWLRHLRLRQLITELALEWRPFSCTTAKGSEAVAWAEECREKARAKSEAKPGSETGSEAGGVIGCAYMKVDAHNIQYIPRQKEYWEKFLRPIAEEWLADYDALSSGLPLPPRTPHTPPPPPIGVFDLGTE